MALNLYLAFFQICIPALAVHPFTLGFFWVFTTHIHKGAKLTIWSQESSYLYRYWIHYLGSSSYLELFAAYERQSPHLNCVSFF